MILIVVKISVIIPTYKPQSYLWECLDSLRNQTFSAVDFEVLLILNGCRDPYQSQIENYLLKNKMSNVRLIQTDQAGVSNARNLGLDNAKGDYIAFVDDDDYVSSTYLEELYAKASPDTISLCYPYAFKDGYPSIQLAYSKTDVYEYYKRHGNTLTLSSKFRKYFSVLYMKLIPMGFIQGRRFDIRFKIGEDSLFMFLISDRFVNFNFTSSSAIYYRRFRGGSALMTKRGFFKKLINSFYLVVYFSIIYFTSFPRYNFLFYLTRIFAAFKSIFL